MLYTFTSSIMSVGVYKRQESLMSTKTQIGCAGIHTSDYGMSYMYIKESACTFICMFKALNKLRLFLCV